jgi:tetratricopeptide (TPR) repeat protein
VKLIERSEDLRAIEEALAGVPAADGRCLLVSGPAGIGKTALLDEACRAGCSRGFELLRATGFEFERGHPFGVVRQLYAEAVRRLDEPGRSQLLGGASAIFAASGTAATADPSHQVLLGLYWLLAELGQAAPLLIAVDDAQWADDPSLRHLLHLSRRLEGLPIALLLAERSGEASAPALDELRAAADPRVKPAPLSGEGARRLIDDAFEQPASAAFAGACLRQTGGYPLYLKETALALREQGIGPDDSAVDALERVEAEGLEQHVWRRVEAVDPAAGKVVGVICVLGEGARRGRIAALAEVPAARAMEIIDGLVVRGILIAGELPRFTHPVVRSAVEARLAPGQRDGLHRAAARLLDGEGAGVEEVGNHLMQCVPEADPWVAARLREFAAEALRRGAPESAAAASARALEEPPPEGDCATVLRELAAAEDAAGRPDEALKRLAEAARRDSGDVRAQVEIAISCAHILASVNRWPEAVESLDRALGLVVGTDATLEQLIDAELITYAIISESARSRGFERLASYGGQAPDGPAGPRF